MSDVPLVSVIMIFLNAEQFISEAIESVLTQTYPDWELLLIDDGSTDGSTKIARQFAARDLQRMHYYHHAGHQNLGTGTSRNVGIRNARGEFVAFLDADDVWLPEKLDHQVSLLQSRPDAGMLYGPTLYWHGWTGRPEDIERDVVVETQIPPGTFLIPPHLLSLYLSYRAPVPCMGSLLVRRKVVDQIGGFDESFKDLFEDQAFYAKVCLAAPVMITGEVLDKYRRHEGSLCATAKRAGRVPAATILYLNWLAEYLSAHGFDHTEIWRDLQKAMRPYKHPRASALWRRWRSRVRQVRRTVGKLHSRI